MTCGATPKLMTDSGPAPTAATPSICPGSIDSIVSLRSLPRMPPVWIPRASIPAKGPRPTPVTNNGGKADLFARGGDPQPPRGREIDDGMRAQVPRATQAEGHRDDDGEQRSPERDADGHDTLPAVHADMREGR